MTTLPATDWTRREDLAQLVATLGAGTIRWVGGAVRDTLLDHPVKDVDAATPHLPEAVIALCKAAGIRTVPTGIDHGTVTALLSGGPVEITTLRKDVSTDGRRATVAFSDDWQEDAARRDFTINALYVDPQTLEIFDYFGGMADLAQGTVRFIGDARERIREDHLRILRFFRFHARFGSDFDAESEQACVDLAPTLKSLSRERVAMELLALLALPDPHETVLHMAKRGILAQILPEVSESGLTCLQELTAWEKSCGATTHPLRRLAAMLPPDPGVVDQVAARLRLSKAQRKRLVTAAARDGNIGDPRALAYRLGMDEAKDRLLLEREPIAMLDGWELPVFPLKGGEIVQRGVTAGPDVARILQAVENRWIEEGFPPRERVEELLAGELGSAG